MFWVKFALAAVAGVVVLMIVLTFLPPQDGPSAGDQRQAEDTATVYDRWQEDSERLRAPVDQPQQPEPDQQPQDAVEPEDSQPSEPQPQQYRQLSPEQQMQAERLLDHAIQSRQQARLPGFTWNRTVDACMQIIEQFPDTEYEMQARRILAEIPQRYRRLLNVTDEQLGPFLDEAAD